ncbi:MAG: putative 6-oxopurine nucleoside phosphorylase [Methanoregula sp. PtaU1.Bin051]|nr:MAG: putative 6-oxopurine nucleoside phosphorylase [Methanoregula sp. PtaU1.Bin051]
MTLGIIGGTSLLFSELPYLAPRRVATPFGSVDLLCGDVVMLMRHQGGLPPHRINFRAGLSALAVTGVDQIVAFGSSGSLKPEIPPGSIVIPTDYMSVSDIPSIHDHAIVHVAPKVSSDISDALARIIPEARYGGIYVQTRGPRIETVAEVQALAKFADIVGMTVASEATLACELGMEFSAVCTVDNYANGLGTIEVTYDHILETARLNRERTGRIVTGIIRKLG